MAKKIRNVKLQEEDIQKNSGKNISHTINKIKANERYYTTILVLIFMVVISVSIYFGLRVDTYNIYADNMTEESVGFSYTSRLVYLNKTNIGIDNNKNLIYDVTMSNMTNANVNYSIRVILDEEKMQECNCNDKLLSYDKLRYSLEDQVERSFTDESMVLTTGFIHPLEREAIPIKIWISEEKNKEEDTYFYGKIVLERIGE